MLWKQADRVETLGELSRRPSSKVIRSFKCMVSKLRDAHCCQPNLGWFLHFFHTVGNHHCQVPPTKWVEIGFCQLFLDAGPQSNTVQDLGQVQQSSPLPQTGAFVGLYFRLKNSCTHWCPIWSPKDLQPLPCRWQLLGSSPDHCSWHPDSGFCSDDVDVLRLNTSSVPHLRFSVVH